jgi:putrescine aminotransferase
MRRVLSASLRAPNVSAAGLFKRGVLVAGTLLNVKTLRIEPASNIPRTLVDELLDKLDETLREPTT